MEIDSVTLGLGVENGSDVVVAGVLARHDASLFPAVGVLGSHAGDVHRHVEVPVGGDRRINIVALLCALQKSVPAPVMESVLPARLYEPGLATPPALIVVPVTAAFAGKLTTPPAMTVGPP